MSTKEDREHLISGEERNRPRRSGIQEGEKKKKSVGRWIRNGFLGVFGLVLLAVLGLYGAGVVYFDEHFFLHTRINGFDASRMDVEAVERIIADKIGSYRLEIEKRGGTNETISADQIDYRYVSRGEAQTFLNSQNAFLWPLCFWNEYSYTFDSDVRYDDALLTQAIGSLECLDEERATPPADAYIDYLDGSYHVIAEVEGNLLNREKTEKLIRDAVAQADARVSLEEANCYQIPERRKNDTGLIQTCGELNTMVSANIVYLFGDNREVLDGKTIHDWIIYEDGQEIELNADRAYEFVFQLAEKYNTADRPREFTTHDGRTVSVSGGYYGWVIDQEAEVAELLQCIRTGFQGERYAVFAQTAVSWENSDLGDSYVEVDLSNQHVWMYLNGEEIVSTACVSGDMMKSDQSTPAGTYTLYYKESPAVLEDEKKTYRTKVTYWMPFNGGIGLHDATWRGDFGGSINQSNGSHGCINLPLDAARTIYENIYEGMPIICYY